MEVRLPAVFPNTADTAGPLGVLIEPYGGGGGGSGVAAAADVRAAIVAVLTETAASASTAAAAAAAAALPTAVLTHEAVVAAKKAGGASTSKFAAAVQAAWTQLLSDLEAKHGDGGAPTAPGGDEEDEDDEAESTARTSRLAAAASAAATAVRTKIVLLDSGVVTSAADAQALVAAGLLHCIVEVRPKSAGPAPNAHAHATGDHSSHARSTSTLSAVGSAGSLVAEGGAEAEAETEAAAAPVADESEEAPVEKPPPAPKGKKGAAGGAKGEPSFVDTLRAAVAKHGDQWKDVVVTAFVFDDHPEAAAPTPQSMREFFSGLLRDREVYATMMATAAIVAVPEDTVDEDTMAALLLEYNTTADSLPAGLCTCATLMFAMREAVVQVTGDVDAVVDEDILAWSSSVLSTTIHLDAGDEAVTEACRACFRDALAPSAVSVGVHAGDEDEPPQQQVPLLAAVRAVTAHELIPGGAGRQGMPLVPAISNCDRRAFATELGTFCTFPPPVLSRTQMLRELEDMLNATDQLVAEPRASKQDVESYKWDLEDWRYYAHVSPASVHQRFTSTLWHDPHIVTRYLPLQDVLLVAQHHPTPRRRIHLNSWNAAHATNRPQGFGQWRSDTKAYTTSLTRPPLAFMDVDAGALARSTHTSRWFFPADHAIGRVQHGSDGQWWMSIALDSHMFGLRQGDVAGMAPTRPVSRASGAGSRPVSRATGERGFKAASVASVPQLPVVGAFPYVFSAQLGASVSMQSSSIVVDAGPSAPGKPDGKGTVIVTNTDAAGLTVQHCSTGWVWQSTALPRLWGKHGPKEIGRQVMNSNGTTVVLFEDGSRKLLYSDGTVSFWIPDGEEEAADGKWIRVAPNGATRVRRDGQPAQQLDAVPVTATIDPDSGCRVTVRHDPNPVTGGGAAAGLDTMVAKKGKRKPVRAIARGVRGAAARAKKKQAERDAAMAKYWTETVQLLGAEFACAAKDAGIGGRVVVVQYQTGDRLVIHADGTHIASYVDPADRSRFQRVVVTAPGLATVDIDVQVDANAKRHAAGLKIATSASGLRSRSLTYCPDGTMVAIDYNTTVTATTNGRVRVHKPDGVIVLAWDGGVVDYRPAATNKKPAVAEFLGTATGANPGPLKTAEEDTDTGVYHFYLAEGRLQATDPEFNVFHADMSGSASVELAGTVSGIGVVPCVNVPVPPRLFVLDGKGECVELLAPKEFAHIKDLSTSLGSDDGFPPVVVYQAGDMNASLLPSDEHNATAASKLQGSPTPRSHVSARSRATARSGATATRAKRPVPDHVKLFDLVRFAGCTLHVPPQMLQGSDSSQFGGSGEHSIQPSLLHTFMDCLVGNGPAAGAGAAVAPSLSSSTVSAVEKPADVTLSGIRQTNGQFLVTAGTVGWAAPRPKNGTVERQPRAVAVPAVVMVGPEHVSAPSAVVVVAEIEEHSQLNAEQRAQLAAQEAACEQWRKDVAAEIDRFDVEDPRAEAVIAAELAMAKKIAKLRAKPKKKRRRNPRRYGGASTEDVPAADTFAPTATLQTEPSFVETLDTMDDGDESPTELPSMESAPSLVVEDPQAERQVDRQAARARAKELAAQRASSRAYDGAKQTGAFWKTRAGQTVRRTLEGEDETKGADVSTGAAFNADWNPHEEDDSPVWNVSHGSPTEDASPAAGGGLAAVRRRVA